MCTVYCAQHKDVFVKKCVRSTVHNIQDVFVTKCVRSTVHNIQDVFVTKCLRSTVHNIQDVFVTKCVTVYRAQLDEMDSSQNFIYRK